MRDGARGSAATHVEVDPGRDGQRVDNFLAGHLKGVPRSLVYRLIRTGQVRVNRGRVQASRRLKAGDIVRVPPVARAEAAPPPRPPEALLAALEAAILHEDDRLLIIDKPAGLAVHGGTGLRYGLIEVLRVLRPEDPDITLVHRLDRDTSGCLLIARDRALLPALAEQFRRHSVYKSYLTLVRGRWKGGARTVQTALSRSRLQSGERMVMADEAGRDADSRFVPLRRLPGATLMEVRIRTGRMHQIRVHAASIGHPVAGDEKYGDPPFNRSMRAVGLRRMFLHAHRVALTVGDERVEAEAELPEALAHVVDALAGEGLQATSRASARKQQRESE